MYLSALFIKFMKTTAKSNESFIGMKASQYGSPGIYHFNQLIHLPVHHPFSLANTIDCCIGDTAIWIKHYKEAKEKCIPIQFELLHTFPQEEKDIYLSCCVFHISGNRFVYVAQDVTHRKNLENTLQTSKEQLEDTVRARTRQLEEALQVKSRYLYRYLISIYLYLYIYFYLYIYIYIYGIIIIPNGLTITRFLAIMSHEMRTPLSGVMGHLTLLSDTSLTPEQQDMVIILVPISTLLLLRYFCFLFSFSYSPLSSIRFILLRFAESNCWW